jgi:hypothetical protein
MLMMLPVFLSSYKVNMRHLRDRMAYRFVKSTLRRLPAMEVGDRNPRDHRCRRSTEYLVPVSKQQQDIRLQIG